MEEVRLYQRTTRDLEDPAVFDAYFEQMPQARKDKILCLKNIEDRKRSLAAGILLCQGLADSGIDGSGVRIAAEEHGRPYLPDFPDIHFSLSHSGEMALAAFSQCEAGCDIEEAKKPNLKIARRFFCPEELEWILQGAKEVRESGSFPGKNTSRQSEKKIREEGSFPGQPSDTQTDRFYRLWVLKESFLKATGRGLSLPMDAFCFSFTPAPCIRQEFDAARYTFEEYRYDLDYRNRLADPVTGCAAQMRFLPESEKAVSGQTYFAAVCLRRPMK